VWTPGTKGKISSSAGNGTLFIQAVSLVTTLTELSRLMYVFYKVYKSWSILVSKQQAKGEEAQKQSFINFRFRSGEVSGQIQAQAALSTCLPYTPPITIFFV
jgi:hypothetical protein